MDTNGFPRQFARTRRFSLGAPRQFTVSPDGERVVFLRSVSGTGARGLLWLHESGRERILADPAGGAAGGAGVGSARRDGGRRRSEVRRVDGERGRENAAGVRTYATDREVRVVAFTVDGALWAVRTDGGAPWPVPVPGPVTDPRPSPDGTLIAYVSRGSLRVVRTDGSRDRSLAEPEGAEVTYGSAVHVTAGRGHLPPALSPPARPRRPSRDAGHLS